MPGWLKNIMPEKIPALGAVLYSALPARAFEPHHRTIAQAILLADGATLLDIGCGPGFLAALIAKRFPSAHVIGIDLSEKMVEIAAKRAGDIPNLKFRVMNGTAMEFADNSLDMVISTASFHHWHDPANALNEIHRVLKPGAPAWIYDGYGDVSNVDIDSGFKRPVRWLPPRWLVRLILRTHGFTLREYQTTVSDIVARSAFRTCSLDPSGILMRITLRKA
jgi:ubiquinone/menaquinone biosynthesis C-methylase UbiE